MALGNGRATQDVDMVIECGTTEGVDDIDAKVQALIDIDPSRFTMNLDTHGEPIIKFDGLAVDLFDPKSWPSRPQYHEFLSQGGSEPQNIARRGDGANNIIYVVSPPLLLREKLTTFANRQGSKQMSDNDDIMFLLDYCHWRKLTLDLTLDNKTNLDARRGLEDLMSFNGNVRGMIEGVIHI